MPGFERVDRQTEELKRGLDQIIRSSVKDPRIPEVFSITKVELTKDLKYAKVHISAMTNNEDERKAMLKALKGATGFIRHELGKTIIMRAIPELRFEFDTSIEYAIHIQSLLNQISEPNSKGSEQKAIKEEERASTDEE